MAEREPATQKAMESKEDLDRIDRIQKVVEGEGVRLIKFIPCGILIWTVAGRDCNYLVDCNPPQGKKPYCTCDDFHYRVLSGKAQECYHLTAARKAIEQEMYSVVELNDEQYPEFVRELLSSIFRHIS